MQFICDAPGGKTWFRIETEGEAAFESDSMSHAVEKHFRHAWEAATDSYQSAGRSFVEQNIGLKDHVRRVMPLFMTLRDVEGNTLATAGNTIPASGSSSSGLRTAIPIRSTRGPSPGSACISASISTAAIAIPTADPGGGKISSPREAPAPCRVTRQYHLTRYPSA